MNKRLVSIIGMAFATAAALAVESTNVVGYQTVTLKPQTYAMIGIPFDGIGSSGINVQDLVVTNGLTAGLTAAQSDNLWYYDPDETGGYIKLFLYNSTATSAAVVARKGKWLVNGSYKDTSWGSNNQISSKILKPGMGLWLVRKDASAPLELKFSGQVIVAEGGTNVVEIREGYNMIAGSFSTDFPLNVVASGAGDTDIDWIGKGCAAGLTAAQADNIWWYDDDETGGYVKTFLYNSTATSAAVVARKNKWLVNGSYKDTSWGSNNQVCTKKIPAGRGFWYVRKANAGAFTLVLDQPYTLD